MCANWHHDILSCNTNRCCECVTGAASSYEKSLSCQSQMQAVGTRIKEVSPFPL